jgi:hypothetical protein
VITKIGSKDYPLNCYKIFVSLKYMLAFVTILIKNIEGVGGLRLLKVLKNTTNMYPKYNMCTGTFEHGIKLYMI